MTLTKANLIDSMHENLDIPRHRCSEMLESLLQTMKGTLENG